MAWDSWIVDGLVNLAARVVWVLSYPVRMLQTGRVSRYGAIHVARRADFLGYYLHSSESRCKTCCIRRRGGQMEFYNTHILSVVLFTRWWERCCCCSCRATAKTRIASSAIYSLSWG